MNLPAPMMVKVYCAHRKRKKWHEREFTIEEPSYAQHVAGSFFCLHCKRRVKVSW